MFFFVIFLIIAIVLQSSVTTIPFVLLILLNFAVSSKNKMIILAGFFAGLVVDILLLNPLGQTSLLLTVFLALVFFYENKYDIQTFPFVFLASFIGSVFYLILSEGRFVIIQAFVSAIISLAFFWGVVQADRIYFKSLRI